MTGLSAAYFLEAQARAARVALDITLLEKSARLGGVIRSERAGEFLCEAGPDSLLTTKPAAIELCQRLGLGEQIIPSNDHQRKTFVLHGGKLERLPEGLMFVVPSRIGPVFASGLLSLGGKLRLAMSPWLSPPLLREDEDISAAQYISARFGAEITARLAEPLLSAVYGADINAMSARAVLPQLVALEKQHGSLWRGVAKQATRLAQRPLAAPGPGAPSSIFVTLRDGLGKLTESIEHSLEQTQVIRNDAARRVRRDAARGRYLVQSDAAERSSDAVIVATPAPMAAELLGECDAALSSRLREVRYHSVAIVVLGYDQARLPQALDGFGFVVPRGEHCQMIACTLVHNKFNHRAPQGQALLRCFFGGARHAGLSQLSDQELLGAARRELAAILQIQAEPAFHRIYRWESCMPQYPVGHLDNLAAIDRRLAEMPGLFLAGNGYRGVGIPDCVQSAAQAASGAVEFLRGGESIPASR